MYRIKESSIDSLFSAAASKSKLYIPTDTTAGTAQFMPWKEGMKLTEAHNTVRSAKDFFFPQTENLVDFRTDGRNIEVIDIRTETEDFVIFGVRACDVRSFSILDKVFPIGCYITQCLAHHVTIMIAIGICEHPVCLLIDKAQYLGHILLLSSLFDLLWCIMVQQAFCFYAIQRGSQLDESVSIGILASLEYRFKLITDMRPAHQVLVSGIVLGKFLVHHIAIRLYGTQEIPQECLYRSLATAVILVIVIEGSRLSASPCSQEPTRTS